jgi:DNA-directed RNA polymerase subunit RPC12/RpoP
MCIATEQICEACGKKYWQGDMLEDHHFKCDECRGRKPPPEEYPLTREQWFEAIQKLQR